MEITKHLLSNLSLLIFFLFFSLVLADRNKKATISKYPFIILIIVLIWTCIQFSYSSSPSLHFDLRLIPYVVGGLYLGLAPFLSLVVVVIRSFYGINTGFFLTLGLYVTYAILFWRMYPWFIRQTTNKRITYSILIGILFSMMTATAIQIAIPIKNWFDLYFAYLIVPALGIGIVSYGIEFFQRNLKMRSQLIKTEKLQAVEQMGAAISHEIRNPLTAAIGFVQLLQDGYLTRKQQDDYLAIVKEELKAAERVIQDYLTFAKPSLVHNENLNVKKELQQVISILQPMANQNSVQITTDFSVVGFIQGDRQKFRQVFINVCKNAVESMPNGGYLNISTEFTRNCISIYIKDTGIGMSKDQLDRLGEPYYSTKGSGGTGLGMMVVYSIVRAMKGSIKVESEVGVGTTFLFKFPTNKDSSEISAEEN
ncbi:ATP-binding protein [Bacillus sp. CGMCC 1.16607]|uniref:ATP-binding protein n=1 Tax=Bacillus sp. CGMCC 1.16607 TaxID=3351842 RepID=UPI003630B786